MAQISKSTTFPDGEFQLDDTLKGIPGGTKPFPLSQIGERRWNVLHEDLPFPLMVLKRSELHHNIRTMQSFLEEHGLSLAPHVKTHMSSQLVQLQLSSGAWAITAGNVAQVQVFRRFGVQRIILANQLVGRQNVRYVVEELNADSGFEFFCLVDSIAGVRHLASLAEQFGLSRPIKVLLEGGYWGGRTGCRTLRQACEVVAELRTARRWLTLAGVEGFEGSISREIPRKHSSR